ncbi:MAG: putative toxin-antitoxin system antitoxin component (TIGR02293 family) [Bacteroidia bacterium]|jgi:putative toxin-antitoxin system antitoxin component (TIGR02293 family)
MKVIDSNEQEINVLNEAFGVYASKVSLANALPFRSSGMSYANFFHNKMLVIHTIRDGIPYSLFELIKNLAPFTENDWAEYLDVSIKTLQRNKKEKNFVFKSIHTEKIIELAEVTQLGSQVFDSNEQFYLWLQTPSISLSRMKPFELLKDSYGKELVMSELNKIEHAVFV